MDVRVRLRAEQDGTREGAADVRVQLGRFGAVLREPS